jgi:hypothetical protein
MEMVWAELSIRPTPQHRDVVALAAEVFGTGTQEGGNIASEWRPHLSLAYDNIEGSDLDLKSVLEVCSDYPSLVGEERKVKGFSLWDMNGKLDEWRMVDRFEL